MCVAFNSGVGFFPLNSIILQRRIIHQISMAVIQMLRLGNRVKIKDHEKFENRFLILYFSIKL